MSKDLEQTTQPTKKFDDSDPAEPKQGRTRGLIPWKPGQSGNPAGRQKGSRNKFSQDFIDETYEVWQKKGKAALHHMADNEPSKFVQMVAGLIPQHFRFEHQHDVMHLTDEQVEQRIRELAASLVSDEAGATAAQPHARKPHRERS